MARLSSQYSNNLNIQYIHYISLPYFLFPFCSCFILLLYFSFCFYIFYISSYYFIYTCLAHLFFILYSLSYMRSIFFIFIPYFFFVSRGIFYFLSNQYATRDRMTAMHFSDNFKSKMADGTLRGGNERGLYNFVVSSYPVDWYSEFGHTRCLR